MIFDNPEALLHPALQEELVAWIRRQLPQAQIFIASHSLKLLARAEPATVFWLSRDLISDRGNVAIEPVRDLSPDARKVFFELYGDDTSSAVLNLILGVESSEYAAFLCACALPCRAVVRAAPEDDAQIHVIIDELRHFRGPWTLLDVGAGAGDLLIGAERLGIANSEWEYVAIADSSEPTLSRRLARLRETTAIAATSRVVEDMESAPAQCDAVVFANVCHALGLDRLAEWLAAALERLRPNEESRCVIHEVEVLRQGEADFVLWTPEDYATIFRSVTDVAVEERTFSRRRGVPLHTTILTRRGDCELPRDLAAILKAAFEALLPLKLKRLLAERAALARIQGGDGSSLSEGIRQRRLAFVSAQCANVIDILVDRRLLDRAASTIAEATAADATP